MEFNEAVEGKSDLLFGFVLITELNRKDNVIGRIQYHSSSVAFEMKFNKFFQKVLELLIFIP